MSFMFDRVNTVSKVKIPLLGRVSVAQLWDFTELRVSEHAYRRFAQRVMRREQADDQSRARCVQYLNLALIVPSANSANLCVARLERRGVIVEFVIVAGGCVSTVLTDNEREPAQLNARTNHAARAKRLNNRYATSSHAQPQWFVKPKVRGAHRHAP